MLPGLLLDPPDLVETLTNVKYDAPSWLAWTLFGVGLFLACAWAYHDLRKEINGDHEPSIISNFIDGTYTFLIGGTNTCVHKQTIEHMKRARRCYRTDVIAPIGEVRTCINRPTQPQQSRKSTSLCRANIHAASKSRIGAHTERNARGECRAHGFWHVRGHQQLNVLRTRRHYRGSIGRRWCREPASGPNVERRCVVSQPR